MLCSKLSWMQLKKVVCYKGLVGAVYTMYHDTSFMIYITKLYRVAWTLDCSLCSYSHGYGLLGVIPFHLPVLSTVPVLSKVSGDRGLRLSTELKR